MKTNYGEEYNRESMYETSRDYFLEGKKVNINGIRCKSLIEVMIEDFRLEVEKEHGLLQQAENALKANNTKEFLNKFSQTIDVSKTTDYLQKRLEGAYKLLERCRAEDEDFNKKIRLEKRTSKCSLDELNELLKGLYAYREKILNYRINGDLINTVSNKTLIATNNYIYEVEQEIKNRLAKEI